MTSFLLGLVLGAAAGAAAVWAWARERDRRREALFAFAAHEIASPLTGIQMTVRNFLGGVFGELPADQRKWLEILQDQAQWLGGVASDLGDLAHLELSGRLKLLPAGFPAAPAMERAAGAWRRQAERWGVKLEAELAPGLPAVHGDEARLERLLRGLVGHAVKFSVQPGEVRVKARPEGAWARFEVAYVPVDQGGGSAPALFDRYYVAKQGKTLRLSGIGFALAEELVARSGGTLKVEREGKLERFTLDLPASAASAGAGPVELAR